MAWDRPETSVRISRLRRFVRQRLASAKTVESESLQVSDAQLLVARSYGFSNWQELEAEVRQEIEGFPS
jgi:hypothetical protein